MFYNVLTIMVSHTNAFLLLFCFNPLGQVRTHFVETNFHAILSMKNDTFLIIRSKLNHINKIESIARIKLYTMRTQKIKLQYHHITRIYLFLLTFSTRSFELN